MFFYGRITILKQKIKPFYFDNQNNKAPPAIENKPTKRSWPSLSATIRLNVSRQACGAIKGITPSKISIRPSAVINVLFIYSWFLIELAFYARLTCRRLHYAYI